jgi:hypothetical protein
MQRAVNPQTGEVLFLVDNQWVPPAQTAKNDKGDTAYLVGNQWEIVPSAPQAPPVKQAPNVMSGDEYLAQVAQRNAQPPERTNGGTAIDTGITFLKGDSC